MPKDDPTPLQKLLKPLQTVLLAGRPVLSARQYRRRMERLQREEPEYYRALIEAKARLEKVAQAMYPPEEERKRLVELENPKD